MRRKDIHLYCVFSIFKPRKFHKCNDQRLILLSMVKLANDTQDDAKMQRHFGGTIRFVYVLIVDPGFYVVSIIQPLS